MTSSPSIPGSNSGRKDKSPEARIACKTRPRLFSPTLDSAGLTFPSIRGVSFLVLPAASASNEPYRRNETPPHPPALVILDKHQTNPRARHQSLHLNPPWNSIIRTSIPVSSSLSYLSHVRTLIQACELPPAPESDPVRPNDAPFPLLPRRHIPHPSPCEYNPAESHYCCPQCYPV